MKPEKYFPPPGNSFIVCASWCKQVDPITEAGERIELIGMERIDQMDYGQLAHLMQNPPEGAAGYIATYFSMN